MAYDPILYATLKPKDLARRLANLEPIAKLYMAQYTDICDSMRSIEAGELILKKLRYQIDLCKKEVFDIGNKYGGSISTAEIMKAALSYGPIISSCTRNYDRIQRAMEDLTEGGLMLGELKQKLEDLRQDMENIQIAKEMQNDL